jgi:hypothetical protein
MSLSTKWGLLRHYWVLVKFVIALLATTILLKYMQILSHLADLTAQTTSSTAELVALRTPSHVVHASAALLALLVAATLSVYKPRGITPYGRRRLRDQRDDTDDDAALTPDRGSTTRTPRWVKVFAMIGIGLVLLVVLGQLTGVMGRHGPGRHTPSDDHGGHRIPG